MFEQLVQQWTHRWIARSDKGTWSKTEVSFSCPWKKSTLKILQKWALVSELR